MDYIFYEGTVRHVSRFGAEKVVQFLSFFLLGSFLLMVSF